MSPNQNMYAKTEDTSMTDEDIEIFAEAELLATFMTEDDDDMDTDDHSEATTNIFRSSKYESGSRSLDASDGDSVFLRGSLVRCSSSLEHSLFNGILLSNDSISKEMNDSISKEMVVEEITVAPDDVLIGQSPNHREHHGNRNLRFQMESYKQEYFDKDTRKCRKIEIARSIVRCIRANGGRFLRRSKSTGSWKEEIDTTKQHGIVASRFRGLKRSMNL